MDGHLQRAVVEKKPVPEIDFTLHTMEDGSQVSTQERVCKGSPIPAEDVLSLTSRRCSSTGDATSY
jgi:hypothetical protein